MLGFIPGGFAVFFMSNITKVTGRHRWQENKLHNPVHEDADARGFVKGLICMNCRKAWFPGGPSPELTGCLTDIDVKRVGPARQNDYLEQEMRMRAEQDRIDPRDMPDLDIQRVPRHVAEQLARGGDR